MTKGPRNPLWVSGTGERTKVKPRGVAESPRRQLSWRPQGGLEKPLEALGEQVLGFSCVLGIAKAKDRSRVSNQDVTAVTEAAVARLGLKMEEVGRFRGNHRTGWCTDCGLRSKGHPRGHRPKQLEDCSAFLRWGYGWEAVLVCFGIYS